MVAYFSSASGLEFADRKGAGATESQVSAFVNFINSASSFYHDDAALRLAYISDQMNKTHGASLEGYSILEDDKSSNYDYVLSLIFSQFAAVSGVDRSFPSKSYLYAQQLAKEEDSRIQLLSLGDNHGMTSDLEKAIKTIIESVETGESCSCDRQEVGRIASLVEQNDKGYWSVVCSSSDDLKGVVYAYKGIGTYVRPKSCNYIIYKWSIGLGSSYLSKA